jgi:phosphodiester glycosidase
MIKPIERILHSLLLLIFIGTSGSIVYYFKIAPSVTPVARRRAISSAIPSLTAAATFTPTPIPSPTSTVKPTQDPDWSLLQPGLERRVLEVHNAQNQPVESLYIWRLDQKYFRMDVAHNERPQSLEAWQKETNAALVVNGGYFSIENEKYFPDGLTVINGKASGRSFAGFGGMLAVDQSKAELRWLVQKPYNAYEPLRAALQSFPILVQPGGELGFPAERDNHARARRTVIAQDQQGCILFIIAPDGYFTLHELSVYLTGSDLNLDIALNLDGGGSTGILVANPREIIHPGTLLPFVILVYPR